MSEGAPATVQATTTGAGGSASPPPGKSDPSMSTDESSPLSAASPSAVIVILAGSSPDPGHAGILTERCFKGKRTPCGPSRQRARSRAARSAG